MPRPKPFATQLIRWRPSNRSVTVQHQEEEAAGYDKARVTNNFNTATVIAGEAVDLIGEIPPAAEIIDRIVAEAASLLAGASNRYHVAEHH